MQLDVPANRIETEERLEEVLSVPTAGLCQMLARLAGDVLILGVGGKMGPTLAKLARRGIEQCGSSARVIGVSRFSSNGLSDQLSDAGIQTIHCDLLDEESVHRLPDARNVIYLAGRKFGTGQDASLTWAMNAHVPALVAKRFAGSRIVVLSSGNIYPFMPIASGGATERDATGPVGEYAQSCLARERMFEFFSRRHHTPMTLVRLNYAVELRYGVLLDIARNVHARRPIDLSVGHVNVIWQRDANEMVLRSLSISASPPEVLNVAGPLLSVRDLARRFGECFGLEPVFHGRENETALLSNGTKAWQLFGEPTVDVETMVRWVAHWVRIGGKTHDLPTHYEQRDGTY